MITDTDIKKLEKKFATKDDLKAMEARQDAKFATKDDLKAFATEESLKKTQKSMEDAIINFKDEILHEIKGLREEISIVMGYKDQIEDIDYRVERLEKHTKIPPLTA